MRIVADEAGREGAPPAAARIAPRAMDGAEIEHDAVARLKRWCEDRVNARPEIGKVHEFGVIGVEILSSCPLLRPDQLRPEMGTQHQPQRVALIDGIERDPEAGRL